LRLSAQLVQALGGSIVAGHNYDGNGPDPT
jgi:hypothetical protein